MLNAIFIIWRECFEAVLIVGILYSYLKRQPEFDRSLRFLAAGVAGGIILSILLAFGIQRAETELQGQALDLFQIGMLVLASLLMTQMCIWMKRHSRTLKSELEAGLSTALGTHHLVGIATLAMLAIAREGAEIVVFLFGMGIETSTSLFAAAAIGAGLTFLTAFAFYRGLKVFNPRIFFGVTTVFLLLTASNLLLGAVRKLVQADILPAIRDQAWDTSFLLDERSGIGQVVAAITSYQSTPSLTLVLAAAAYWAVTLLLLRSAGSR